MPNWIRAAEREHDATIPVIISHLQCTAAAYIHLHDIFNSIYTCIENGVLIYHYI